MVLGLRIVAGSNSHFPGTILDYNHKKRLRKRGALDYGETPPSFM
jgi:hypothetical protein